MTDTQIISFDGVPLERLDDYLTGLGMDGEFTLAQINAAVDAARAAGSEHG